MNVKLKWGLIIGGSVAVLGTAIGIYMYKQKRTAAIAKRCGGFSGAQLENCRALFIGKTLEQIKTAPIVGTQKPGAS